METTGKAAVTIRDVARAAGVSAATASRALHGSGGRVVSPEKRALIRKVADQLQYRPAATARRAVETGVASRRSRSIGLILKATYRYTDPFWSPVLEGLTEEVLRQGYHIDFSLLADDLRHDQRSRAIQSRTIDGLILIGDIMGYARDFVDLAPPGHVVIIVGADAARWESDVRFDVITMEKHAAMDTLVGHLVDLGRRRLGFLGPALDDDRRSEGFVHALARRGLTLAPELFVECGFSTDAGYTAARALLAGHASALDGLVCACDTIAIGAMRAAKECGLVLPADLAIAGFDNIPFSRDLDPPLTTIQVPKELMGELAARRLSERIAHPDWPPIIQTVPTSLVPRRSCGEQYAE